MSPDGTPPSPVPDLRLDELISAIDLVHPDQLDRLTSAVVAADHLDTVADHLIGHFVDQARRSGASWTDIGRAMGVSKQAARQRFVAGGPAVPADLEGSGALDRCTARTRAGIDAAHELAVADGSDSVAPAHLLLGMLTEPAAIGPRALVAAGVSTDALAEVARARTRRSGPIDLDPAERGSPTPRPEATLPGEPRRLPYSAEVRRVFELTFRDALRRGHNYLGTEHLLTALLDSGAIDPILDALAVDRPAVLGAIDAAVAALTPGS